MNLTLEEQWKLQVFDHFALLTVVYPLWMHVLDEWLLQAHQKHALSCCNYSFTKL